MIRTTLTIAAGTGLFLMSQAPMVEAPWEQYITKGGSFAVLVFVLLRLLTKTIPSMEETSRLNAKSHENAVAMIGEIFKTEVKEQREAHTCEVQELGRRFADQQKKLIDFVTKGNHGQS